MAQELKPGLAKCKPEMTPLERALEYLRREADRIESELIENNDGKIVARMLPDKTKETEK